MVNLCKPYSRSCLKGIEKSIPFLFWNIRVYNGFKIKYNKNIIKYESSKRFT